MVMHGSMQFRRIKLVDIFFASVAAVAAFLRGVVFAPLRRLLGTQRGEAVVASALHGPAAHEQRVNRQALERGRRAQINGGLERIAELCCFAPVCAVYASDCAAAETARTAAVCSVCAGMRCRVWR